MQAISGLSGYQQPQHQTTKITEQQGKDLTEFLSEYDAENLSDENAKEIVAKIQDLGIVPGAGLASVLSEAGVDARGLAEQAGISGPSGAGGPPGGPRGAGGPPPSGGGKGAESVDDAVVSLIADAVSAFEDSEDAESLWSILEPALEEAGYDTTQPVIDFYS